MIHIRVSNFEVSQIEILDNLRTSSQSKQHKLLSNSWRQHSNSVYGTFHIKSDTILLKHLRSS